jgi:hypothetical protein
VITPTFVSLRPNKWSRWPPVLRNLGLDFYKGEGCNTPGITVAAIVAL